MANKSTRFELDNSIAGRTTVVANIDSVVVAVNEDKLRLKLNEFERHISSKYAWRGPLSICLTALITLASSEFKDSLVLTKSVWNNLFICVAIISAFFTVYEGAKAVKNKSKSSVDHLISEIKTNVPVSKTPRDTRFDS